MSFFSWQLDAMLTRLVITRFLQLGALRRWNER